MIAPATERVLRSVAATVSVTLTDQDGSFTAAIGTVTVDIAKADGTVVATGRATTGTGPYVAALTAAETASLNVLTCTWKDAGTARATTTVEIVGGYYFSVADAVAFDSSLENSSNYPEAKILTLRREVEDECERITGVAWVPRFRRTTLTAAKVTTVLLPDPRPRAIVSVRSYTDPTTYTAFTQDDIDALTINPSGTVTRTSCFPANPTVEYEYGYDSPPADLRHACLTRLRTRANMELRGVSDYATAFVQQGGGTFTIAQPGRAGYETGIPEVDAVYKRYSHKIPGIA